MKASMGVEWSVHVESRLAPWEYVECMECTCEG